VRHTLQAAEQSHNILFRVPARKGTRKIPWEGQSGGGTEEGNLAETGGRCGPRPHLGRGCLPLRPQG
jgi:hypothetical protein